MGWAGKVGWVMEMFLRVAAGKGKWDMAEEGLGKGREGTTWTRETSTVGVEGKSRKVSGSYTHIQTVTTRVG